MKLLITIVLLHLMQSVLSQGTPRVVSIAEDQIKSIGASVDFACSTQNSESYQVLWSKLGNNGANDLLISKNANLSFGTDKYTVKAFADPLSTTYVLHIKDVNETDAGFYECQILVSAKRKVTAQVELQICKTPFVGSDDFSLLPNISNMPEKVVKYLGDTVEFVCAVKNNQNLHPVLWMKGNSSDNNELPIIVSANSHLILSNSRFSILFEPAYPNNYTLQIRNIQKTDVGVYRCLVPISATSKTFSQVELKIDENEISRIVQISPETRQFEESDVQFDCKVENRKGHPVLWAKVSDDDQVSALILSYKTMIVSAIEKYGVTYNEKTSTYTLKVKNVKDSDAGSYQCRIDTGSTVVSEEVKLYVDKRYFWPTLPSSSELGNIDDNNTEDDIFAA